MKLIIVGATGFLGTELLRQALARSDVTSIVAVTRRALPASKEGNNGQGKVTNVVVKDYDVYDETAKRAFRGAEGCIWTIAITPRRSTSFPWDEVVRICQTSTLVGLRTMVESEPANPFRFVYVSGAAGERDPTKKSWYKPEYMSLRGETETKVLSYAASHGSSLEVAIAKPGLIVEPGNIAKQVLTTGLGWTGVVPSVGLRDISKALLDQVVGGFEKETLENADLVRLGRED